MADKLTKFEERFAAGQRNYRDLLKTELQMKIHHTQKNLDTKITRFLLSNSRVDRDAVLKKREELLTYKQILKHELFQ